MQVNRPQKITRFLLMYILSASLTPHRTHAMELTRLKIKHPYDDIIFGYRLPGPVDNTGARDASAAINAALMAVFHEGGGALYLPAGMYRLDTPLRVPAGTALRGDIQKPGSGPIDVTTNTILCAYCGKGMTERGAALVTLDGSSLIDGVVIWYPQQDVERPIPYPPAIRHLNQYGQWAINGVSRNLFLVNPYVGIQLGRDDYGTCIQTLKNIWGTPLRKGIEVWKDADVPRMIDIDFRPDYWSSTRFPGGPRPTLVRQYTYENGSGIVYHRTDGSALTNIRIRGYRVGLELTDGHRWEENPKVWIDNEGHYINFDIQDCHDAVYIRNLKDHGTQFYNCRLQGNRSALFVENPTHGPEVAMFMKCRLSGGTAAVMQSWDEKTNDNFTLLFTACSFENRVQWTGGKLSMVNCDFTFTGPHMVFGPNTSKALICGSAGQPQIVNRAGNRVKVNPKRVPGIDPPAYNYPSARISSYKPARQHVEIVPPGNGVTDDTHRIQAAIDRVSGQGGGYVVLRPGEYTLKQQLVVKPSVELRGAIDSWQHSKFISHYAMKKETKGVVLYVQYGEGKPDDAAIILQVNAGLNGLMFHYPGQEYDTATKQVLHTYAWLIRLQGNRSYVKHVTTVNAWRFVDISTHSPKDTYVGYCCGAPLEIGISVGESPNCMIDNVHFNSWYWNVVSFPNKPSEISRSTRYKEELDNWMKANTRAFVFAGSQHLNVYGSFIFCSRQAFTLLPGTNSGIGPDGVVVNSGNDWSKYGLYAHANNGLTFLNTHFIDVADNDDDRTICSIFTAPTLNSEIDLYNLSTWGSSPALTRMSGTPSSRINILNLSYQLRETPQVNLLTGGHLNIVNATRNRARHDTVVFRTGDRAKFTLSAYSFPRKLKIGRPPNEREVRPGAYSFP